MGTGKPPIEIQYVGPRDNGADILIQARSIRKAALTELRRARARARSGLAAKLAAAKRRARRRGIRAGLEEASRSLSEEYVKLEKLYVETVRAANGICLDIALSAAADIIGTEISNNHAGLAEKISRLLEESAAASEFSVRVGPGAAAEIRKALKQLDLDCTFSVTADREIPCGNALIQSAAGQLRIDWRDELRAAREEMHRALTGKIAELAGSAA